MSDPRHNGQATKAREYVFVPLGELEAWSDVPSNASLRTEMEIIQRLKKIYGQGAGKQSFMHGAGSLPTFDQVEKQLLEQYIDTYRPHTNWSTIASMLGIERSTLRRKRNEHDLD